MLQKYKIKINSNKVKIIVRKKDAELRKFRKKLPEKFRDIKFEKEGTILGQKVSLQNNTNIAVNARLSKAKGAWGIIKKRILSDKEIRNKVKLDLRNAAIMSIMKYGISTITTTQASGGKMQPFASKCIRSIVIGNNTNGENNRINNYTVRKIINYLPCSHKIKR